MKNVKLTDKAHKILKEFCRENGYKMSGLLERIVLDFIVESDK